MKHFKLQIITPENVVYECDDAVRIDVPTKAGRIGILAEHTPILSALRPGEITVTRDGKDDYDVSMAVSEGLVEVRNNGNVVILSDTAERAEHIDLARAEAGRKRAEEMLAEKETLKEEDFAKFTSSLEKELVRLKVGTKSGSRQ